MQYSGAGPIMNGASEYWPIVTGDVISIDDDT